MNVIDSIVTQAASIAAVRRDIHAHPELCFEEVRTAAVVAQKLTEWGIPIHRGLGKTGVVGIVMACMMCALATAAWLWRRVPLPPGAKR